MVRCRAKGENYSYDFAASLQNTNEQSILISEKDLTAWKGAAERMLTNEIVLKVFSDYLNRDRVNSLDTLRIVTFGTAQLNEPLAVAAAHHGGNTDFA